MYDISHMPQSIEIGFTGETCFRKIEIDMSAWMAIMPDGVPSIVHIRPGETTAQAYIAATTFEDNVLTWEVTAGDIGTVEGTGLAQIWLEAEANDSVIKRGKSTLVSTIVRMALNDASEVVPEPQTAWLEAMSGLKVETVTAKVAAEAAQAAAETAKTEAQSARDLAQNSQEAAYNSEERASGFAEDAEEHVATAASYATDAFTAKTEAEQAKDVILGMRATASGLPAGAAPTVSYENGVMSFGIPKGDPGSKEALPPGGFYGQILTKQSAEDGDADWENAPDPTGKADKVSGATEGNFAGLDENGNLTDSGHKHSDYLTAHQDITGKADKVASATSGNFAGLDSNGNLVDSGHKHSDYLTQHQDITGKVDKNQGAGNAGKALGIGNDGMVTPVPFSGEDFTGATASSAGVHGYVPAPAISERKKFLCGDGTWNDQEGSKLVVFDLGTVTNSGGSCTHTTVISGVSHDMKPVMIECDNPDAFQSLIHVTTADGSITLTCDEVNGTSDVSVSCMFVANADPLTSSEFDILANRIGSLSDLDTTDKSDLVSAVNEVVGDVANFGKVIKSVTSDGTKTFAQIMTSLFSGVTVSLSKTFIKHSTGRIFRCFNENAKEFIQIDGFDVGYASLLIRVITSNGYYEASNTLTLTNYSSSVVGANQTWSLVTYG